MLYLLGYRKLASQAAVLHDDISPHSTPSNRTFLGRLQCVLLLGAVRYDRDEEPQCLEVS